jgi:hypothetical protein
MNIKFSKDWPEFQLQWIVGLLALLVAGLSPLEAAQNIPSADSKTPKVQRSEDRILQIRREAAELYAQAQKGASRSQLQTLDQRALQLIRELQQMGYQRALALKRPVSSSEMDITRAFGGAIPAQRKEKSSGVQIGSALRHTPPPTTGMQAPARAPAGMAPGAAQRKERSPGVQIGSALRHTPPPTTGMQAPARAPAGMAPGTAQRKERSPGVQIGSALRHPPPPQPPAGAIAPARGPAGKTGPGASRLAKMQPALREAGLPKLEIVSANVRPAGQLIAGSRVTLQVMVRNTGRGKSRPDSRLSVKCAGPAAGCGLEQLRGSVTSLGNLPPSATRRLSIALRPQAGQHTVILETGDHRLKKVVSVGESRATTEMIRQIPRQTGEIIKQKQAPAKPRATPETLRQVPPMQRMVK